MKQIIVWLCISLWTIHVNACPDLQQTKRASVSETTNNIDIISVERIINHDDPYAGICSNFSLTRDEILTFFNTADPVDGMTIHHEAIILPCQYQGQLSLNGKLLNWQVIAGGSGALYDDQGYQQEFLCRETTCCNQFRTLC